jgi:hypothetical protein
VEEMRAFVKNCIDFSHESLVLFVALKVSLDHNGVAFCAVLLCLM